MDGDTLLVRVDQDLCTGDGLCVQLAPAVFEFDVDGLAYVKSPDGTLLTDPGARVAVPAKCVKDVVESAEGCPGDCIFVERADGSSVAGPGTAARTGD
jgi:ferredoxin